MRQGLPHDLGAAVVRAAHYGHSLAALVEDRSVERVELFPVYGLRLYAYPLVVLDYAVVGLSVHPAAEQRVGEHLACGGNVNQALGVEEGYVRAGRRSHVLQQVQPFALLHIPEPFQTLAPGFDDVLYGAYLLRHHIGGVDAVAVEYEFDAHSRQHYQGQGHGYGQHYAYPVLECPSEQIVAFPPQHEQRQQHQQHGGIEREYGRKQGQHAP